MERFEYLFGEVKITDSSVNLSGSYLRAIKRITGSVYIVLTFAMIIIVFIRGLYDPFPLWREMYLAFFIYVAIVFTWAGIIRLQPKVSQSTSIPRDTIKQVYCNDGEQIIGPARFVIEFNENGKTKFRRINLSKVARKRGLDAGRQAFEAIGFEPRPSPPPLNPLAAAIQKVRGPQPKPASESTAKAELDSRISWWWLGVAIPVGVSLLFWLGGELVLASVDTVNLSTFRFLQGTLALLMLLVLSLPLLPICMYLDTRRIRASGAAWNPRPALWGILGLVPLIVFIISPLSLLPVTIVGVFYLARRYLAVRLN